MKKKILKPILTAILCSFSLTLGACSLDDILSNFTQSNETQNEDNKEDDKTNVDETISVTSISLLEKSLNMEIGDQETLSFTILPSNATDKSVTWSSNKPDIASVDSNGVVTAKAEGSATITVSTVDGNFTDICSVTVTTPAPQVISVKGVSLNTENLALAVGAEANLVASVIPSNADNAKVTWSSSDNDVATVSSRGKVTGIAAGEANITVTTDDGSYTATCKVTVSETTIHVTEISLNYDTATLYVGKTLTLTPTVLPSNASEKSVSWSSSNESIATVDNGIVTGVAEGEATITATTTDGGLSAQCLFTIEKESTGGDDYIPDPDEEGILSITATTLESVTPNSKGEYEFTIKGTYKQIYVNTPDAKIILNFEGTTIENNENSPVYVADCDSIDISAKKNTENFVKDTRSIYTEDEDGQGKGAIYVANGDLKLKGTGTLNISANYYNGVHGKDDVEIQKQTLTITAVNHGIKGNDSITINSGNINISCGGDGLHTENSDLSSKGNQRGNVTIDGGTITINSWGDAIQASYNALINEADASVPTVITAATNKKSSYTGQIVETSESSFYIKMNSSTYSNGSYKYAALIDGNWYEASYKGTQSSGGPGRPGPGGQGGSSTYYIYQISKPSLATSFKLYRFASSITTYSTSNYNAYSDAKAFNSAYDIVQISVSSGKISFGNWSNYSSNGNDVSCKGIKAENEIYVTAGTININAYDDGIHANNDGSLENGSTPLGNVNISGGNITIASGDDGVHADYTLEISGGSVNVTSAYEGLEGNLIKISGGESYVYATDDGVNASSGKSSPNITVSGGYLDVEVPTSGDTDGIDSNGTYTQTGGTVIVKGPGSASSTNFGAAALDTDSTVKITSGSLIVFGGIEQTPSSSVTKTLCSSSTVSTGSHTVSFSSGSISYTTTLKSSTKGCVVYSSLGTATLK